MTPQRSETISHAVGALQMRGLPGGQFSDGQDTPSHETYPWINFAQTQ